MIPSDRKVPLVKIRYVGRATKGVFVPDAGVFAEHGATVEIPKTFADSLLNSGEWEKVASTTPPTTESEADES